MRQSQLPLSGPSAWQHLEHKSTGTMKGSETLNYSQQTMSTPILTNETL